MKRVLSGIQPTGGVHLGNYFGAFRNWVSDQHDTDAFFCIVDLHALTVDHDPAQLARTTLEMATMFLAVGLDPSACTLFVQSHVLQHTALTWLLECTASFGELSRMTQFKDKGKGRESVSAGLFTYPVLMAADILAYDTDSVPVGHDQKQHLELARNIAIRFNGRYGDTFKVPQPDIPKVGARIMDLQDPTSKMSKSSKSEQGLIYLLDDPATIEKKIKRAVTDAEPEVRFDPESKPGVSNLLTLLAAATDKTPDDAAKGLVNYGSLKHSAAEAIIEMVRPIQERYRQLSADTSEVSRLLANGAQKASEIAEATVRRAGDAVGLLPKSF